MVKVVVVLQQLLAVVRGEHEERIVEKSAVGKRIPDFSCHGVRVQYLAVVEPDYMGEVIGDLNSRRGRVGGMVQRGEAQVIGASVPLAEMFGYSTSLRSNTQGRAAYSMQFSHYSEVPQSKADEIISKGKG